MSNKKQMPDCFAFAQNERDEVRIFAGHGQIVGALAANPGVKQTCYVCIRKEMVAKEEPHE